MMSLSARWPRPSFCQKSHVKKPSICLSARLGEIVKIKTFYLHLKIKTFYLRLKDQNLLSTQVMENGTSMEFRLYKCLLVCSNQLLDQNEHN